MTKAIATLTRKWLLAASLCLAAGGAPLAAHATTGYQLDEDGYLQYSQNGFVTWSEYGRAHFTQVYLTQAVCQAAQAGIQPAMATLAAFINTNVMDGYTEVRGTAAGGCNPVQLSSPTFAAVAAGQTLALLNWQIYYSGQTFNDLAGFKSVVHITLTSAAACTAEASVKGGGPILQQYMTYPGWGPVAYGGQTNQGNTEGFVNLDGEICF